MDSELTRAELTTPLPPHTDIRSLSPSNPPCAPCDGATLSPHRTDGRDSIPVITRTQLQF